MPPPIEALMVGPACDFDGPPADPWLLALLVGLAAADTGPAAAIAGGAMPPGVVAAGAAAALIGGVMPLARLVPLDPREPVLLAGAVPAFAVVWRGVGSKAGEAAAIAAPAMTAINWPFCLSSSEAVASVGGGETAGPSTAG